MKVKYKSKKGFVTWTNKNKQGKNVKEKQHWSLLTVHWSRLLVAGEAGGEFI